MSETSGVREAVRLLELVINEVDWQGMVVPPLSKAEVLARLESVRVALVDVMPEWAEVSITELLGERDRARSLAVRLEQELAEADQWIEAYKAFVAQLEAKAAEVMSL